MNILKYTKFFIVFSLTLILLGLGTIITYGFKTSIEYTGGSVIQFKHFEGFGKKIDELNQKIEFELKDLYEKDGVVVLKISDTDNSKIQNLITEFKIIHPGLEVTDISVIGSSMGIEFAKNSFLAVVISLLAILLYVAYSFNSLSEKVSSWYLGLAALIALFHDILAVVSFFSLAGYFYNLEIDALFLTALLTIVGFSINDTIVVFDRFRENLKKYENTKSLSEIFNLSIFETLNRSIITSFVVVIVMFSLFLFGSGSLKYFSLALVVGILTGTYSSIFVATPVVLFLKKVKK
jgi:preprotein translocase subunit SecF